MGNTKKNEKGGISFDFYSVLPRLSLLFRAQQQQREKYAD
jgi:hypothetical protein